VKGRVRSGQLELDQRNVSRSRLRTQPHGRGCTSQLYQCASANPVIDIGSGCLCTREPLYRLVLSASYVSNLPAPRSCSKSGVAVSWWVEGEVLVVHCLNRCR
jgi:hypothetical protein